MIKGPPPKFHGTWDNLPTPRAPAALAEHRTSRILPNTGTASGGPSSAPRILTSRGTRRSAAA